MSKYETAGIRNIAFIGGPGTGKTSVVEALLHATGAVKRLGSVADGTTASDFDAEEKEKQHSVRAALLHTEYKGCHFNLLDAPGYPDFVGEAASCMAAAETAALVVNAHEGITFAAHKTWDLAAHTGAARVLILTHLDQAEGSVMELCEAYGEALGVRCLPVNLPDQVGSGLSSVTPVPFEGGEGEFAAAREALIEAVVEIDEEAMMAFLEEDKAPDEKQARELMKRSLIARELVPVVCVDALNGHGVEALLEFIKNELPSPVDGPFYKCVEGEPVPPDAEGTTLFVFKTIIDNFVGKLAVMRVVCGEVAPGATLKLARTGKNVKLAHLQSMQGKDHAEVERAVAGDIIAVSKIDDLEISDTLSDPAHDRVLAGMVVPKPMAARAIEPHDHGDELKLATALRRAASESPCFSYERDAFTGQLVVHGTSIMHIESELKRIKERSGVEVKVEIPRVALKETITAPSDGHHRHKKQTGGRGQFAEVMLSVEPGERGTGLEFLDETVGGSVPKNFLPAIEKGVVEVMSKGIIAGYPVVDVIVRIKDGKFHDVDSDEASFKLAGGRAFKDGFMKARPVLLEPLLDMEVAVPSRFMGAITSDMTGRRGQIAGMDSLGDIQIVRSRVPQREVMTYPTVLHSLTSGEGSFTAGFSDYEVVPANVQQEIMAEYKPDDEE